MDSSTQSVHIGIAGWDYPDWDGIVYPAGPRRGFDRLSHVARFVDLVEVNSTFYRPVLPRVAERWLERTRDMPRLLFTAKAHRSLTHEAPLADVAETARPTLAGLEPLRSAGRLGALLLQFPQSFHFESANVVHLERLAGALEGWPVAVEVRHASWGAVEAEHAFRALGLGWCAVDQPRVGRSSVELVERVTSSIGYLRMHGRNRSAWFRPDVGRDARYDYLYPHDELWAVGESVHRLAESTRALFVVQNNHFRGQALANALQLRSWIEGVKPAAPAALVDLYPGIAPDVVPVRDSLF